MERFYSEIYTFSSFKYKNYLRPFLGGRSSRFDNASAFPAVTDSTKDEANSTEAPVCQCTTSPNSWTEDEEYVCIYDNEEIIPMTHSMVWITYTVLCEVFMKIGPCILLVVLNVIMIQVCMTEFPIRQCLRCNEDFFMSGFQRFCTETTEIDGHRVHDLKLGVISNPKRTRRTVPGL